MDSDKGKVVESRTMDWEAWRGCQILGTISCFPIWGWGEMKMERCLPRPGMQWSSAENCSSHFSCTIPKCSQCYPKVLLCFSPDKQSACATDALLSINPQGRSFGLPAISRSAYDRKVEISKAWLNCLNMESSVSLVTVTCSLAVILQKCSSPITSHLPSLCRYLRHPLMSHRTTDLDI